MADTTRTEEAVTDPIEFERDGVRYTLACIADDQHTENHDATPSDIAAAGYVHGDALEAVESERDELKQSAQHQADRIAELEADLANCEAARRVEKQERDFLRNDSVVRFQERLIAALRETPEDGRGFHSPFTLLADRLASPPVQAAEPEAGERPRCTCSTGPVRAGQIHADWCLLRAHLEPPPQPKFGGPADALRAEIVEALRFTTYGASDAHVKMALRQLADRLERRAGEPRDETPDPEPRSPDAR